MTTRKLPGPKVGSSNPSRVYPLTYRINTWCLLPTLVLGINMIGQELVSTVYSDNVIVIYWVMVLVAWSPSEAAL